MARLSLRFRPFSIGFLALAQLGSTSAPPDTLAKPRILRAYGKLPLSFEANLGQTDRRVKFLSRGSGYGLFLTSTEAVLALRSGRCKDVLRIKLVGSNPRAEVTGEGELPGKSNYFIGNDPKNWRTKVSQYGKVRYRDVYPGVDLVFYGNQQQLEYDFVVAPGNDPSSIKLAFSGASKIEVDGQGDLLLRMGAGEIRLHKPVVYQEANGGRRAIEGGYVLEGRRRVGFRLAAYDASKSLVIDPTLVYSTYLGGSNGDQASGIAIDAGGNAYVVGSTFSADFPTVNAVQAVFGSGNTFSAEAFVAKLNTAGSGLVYSTYLGGSSDDSGLGIAVDAAGEALVTGYTLSNNFPTTPGAFQTTRKGFQDAFVAKLNASGSALIYSTYLGGTSSDVGLGIAVDASGNAYVTGQGSSDFPTTPGAFRSGCCSFSAFAAKLNASGTAFVYSTFLGGAFPDFGRAIAVDTFGNAYVTGQTSSSSFPTTPGSFQTASGGADDTFVTKLNATGSAQVYSTFLGGSGSDAGYGIAVDSSGNAYVTGSTASPNFPTRNASQGASGRGSDAFVSKLNADGTALVFSTFLGGDGYDLGRAIALDSSGNAYVTGETSSTNFLTTLGAFKTTSSCCDAFVTKLDAAGAFVFSSYLGGSGTDFGAAIAADSSGTAYVAGGTSSTDFPTANALQSVLSGAFSTDAFISKIVAANAIPALSSLSPVSAVAGGVGFALTVNGSNFVAGAVVRWNGADRPTTFLSGSRLSASIPPSDIASAGTAQVTVLNPPPGGGLSNALTFTVVPQGSNPIPTISSLFPAVFAGGTSFTLSVVGLNFVQTSVVRWNGSDRPTTFYSSTQLFASIAATDIAASGTAQVTVFNPAPVGGLSNEVALTITAPQPAVTALSPDYATAGGSAFTLTVTGSNLIANSVVRWNGSDRVTTFVSATQLRATISAADIAAAGAAQVTVFNPAPGGGISNARSFSILAPGVSPVPVLSSLSPSGAVASGPGFTLTVNGLDFVSGSVVRWNGIGRATTFVGGTQLQAAILTSDLTVSGPAQVTVFNPAPGGGTSNSLTFTIFPPGSNPVPALISLAPVSATAGSGAFTLTVTGTGFVAGSVVQWDQGTSSFAFFESRTTAFLSSTQLQASILAFDISFAGTAHVRVFNPSPGGGFSNVLNFTVDPRPPNPVPVLSSLSPAAATVGGVGFTFTVSGSNFLTGSVVRWNGSNRSTSFVSSTQLRATIFASDIARAGIAQVTVFNPTPGGGLSNALTFLIQSPPEPNPVPVLASLSPSSATAGGAAFTLTVNGSNFIFGSAVRWNGLDRPTTFASEGQLTASIPAGDIAAAGAAQVTVFNPAPGGGASNPLTLTVNRPPSQVPALSSLSPSSATAGGAGFSVTVSGSNFVNDSVVRWNGSNRATTFVSATQLRASISAGDIAAAGTAQVTVFNPAPGGGTSAAIVFTINNPVPSLVSLSPSSATARGAAFTLTVSGSGFVTGSVVRWNGADRSTTFVSSTQLTGTIPTADIAAAGMAQVTVFNPEPGGGTSNPVVFTIERGPNPVPALLSLSPASAVAGGPAFTLTVTGAGFVPESVIRWNGEDRNTGFVSATRLTASIPASDISFSGSAQISVFNPTPGGGNSNALSFAIQLPPIINPVGLLNGASFSNTLGGGSIATLFSVLGTNLAAGTAMASTVPLPTTLAGTTVRLDGIAAPLFFVSPLQINFQIPWELLGQAQALLRVTVAGVTSNAITVNLAAYSPALFSTDQRGSGQGAIAISGAGGALAAPVGAFPNSRPVRRGEFLELFAMGLGQVTNRPATGAAAPSNPLSTTAAIPTVTIGGVPVAVSFSGLAPGFVALYQVNVQVPANAPAGEAVPVILTIGGAPSNAVTIAVQ